MRRIALKRAQHQISNKQREILFQGLSRLIDAGLPISSALQHIGNEKIHTGAAAAQIKNGATLHQAGLENYLFDSTDARLIEAAENSGQLSSVLHLLGEHYRKINQHSRVVMKNLALPGLLLLAIVIITPLPALIRGELSLVIYTLRLVLITLVIYLFYRTRLKEYVVSILAWLPGIKVLQHRKQTARFINILGLAWQAGLPADLAVKIAADQLPDNYRTRAITAVQHIKQGESLSSSLEALGLPLSESIKAIISTGEASGKIDSSLLRLGNQADAEYQQTLETLSIWLPRTVYSLVVIIAAFGILSG